MQRSRHGQDVKLMTVALLLGLAAEPAAAMQPTVVAPPAFGVGAQTPLMVAYGVGAQIYECAPDASGRTAWTFREPVATLISDGKTVGRHYRGPTWALTDGVVITGKVSASEPGATPADIPLLKLDVIERHGEGALGAATLVLRLNTHGGDLKGGCERAGELRAEPYSADYIFLR
jgi:hypothetical protein